MAIDIRRIWSLKVIFYLFGTHQIYDVITAFDCVIKHIYLRQYLKNHLTFETVISVVSFELLLTVLWTMTFTCLAPKGHLYTTYVYTYI